MVEEVEVTELFSFSIVTPIIITELSKKVRGRWRYPEAGGAPEGT